MTNKNKSTTPEFRKVVVDIATHDDDGNPITDAMLSSGGARDYGPIVKQYTNPQPYEQAPVRSDEDRQVDAYRQREADRRQRRKEDAEERRRRENQEFAVELLKRVLDGAEWLRREVVAPWARRKWDERKARKLTLHESQAEGNAVGYSPTDDEPAVVAVECGADIAESAAANDIATVVQIEDYRRSA